MLRPVPPLPLRPATSGLGLGLFGCGALVVAGRVVGPSPRSLAFMLGAVIAGCWVGGLFPARRLPRATPLAAGALALGGSVLVEPGARALGAGLDWIGASAGMLAPAIAGGAFLSAVGLGWLSRGVPAARAVTLAGAAAGIAVGALLGPAPSLTLGAAALAWRRDSSTAGRAGPGWVLLPVGTAAVLLLSALQPSTSPSPGGALAFALGAIGSGTMFALLPMREERAVWWGLFSLAVTAAAPVLLPELTAEMAPLALGASPARGRVLLLLPLVIGGTAIGPALAALLPARHGPLALAAGLAGGALMPLGVTAGTAAAVGAGLVALGTAPPLTRAIAAALVAGLLASDWQGWVGDPAALGTGVHRTVRSAEAWDREQKVRPGLVDVVSEVGVLGASVVRAPLAWTETQGQRGRPDRWAHHVEQQGTISTSIGREAEAELLAGHLGGLFAPDDAQALVLGDPAARVLGRLLAHPTGAIDVSTPSPAAVRAVALLDPDAQQAWLSSRVQLHASHPDALLRRTHAAGLIVEVARTSWRDAIHATPDETHLDAVQAALRDDGIYVLTVHLSRFDQGSVAALARAVSARFDHIQLWIPPSGADTLFVVAGPAAPSLTAFKERVPRALLDLQTLGIPSASVLAGFAIGDADSANAWQPGGHAPAPLRMPDATFQKPVMHLASLAPHVASPAALWDLTGSEQDAAGLTRRIAGRQTFLALLGDASTGDLQGVFAAASDLVQREGPLATQALEALIEPQLDQARDALRIAVREGPSSRRWEDAQRYAATARMLSPRSPDPPLLLGEVALAQGNLNRSQEHFEAALELDDRSTAARTGLARVAIARKDYATAEQQLRSAARLNPQDWQAWSNLGRHLTETGASEEAEEVLRRAATLAGPDATDPHLRLAELYLATGRPTTALVHSERAVTLSGSAEAFYLRGRGYYDVDEPDKAEEDFRRAVLADSRHVRARGAIGVIRAEKGDLQAAAENFRQVVAMDPTNAAARENLARAEALLRQQGFEGAAVVPPG